MQKLLKRLSIIQSAINLEDDELIAGQLTHLQPLLAEHPTLSARLNPIVRALQALDYAKAYQDITQFLSEQSQMSVYSDPEISALRLELAGLEKQMAQLQYQKDDCIKTLHQFNAQYHAQLGQRLQKMLQLRLMISHFYSQSQKVSEKEREHAWQEYQEYQQHFQDFYQENQKQSEKPQIQPLNDNELKRLKTAYRKACRLCHPDMMADELKQKATEVFQQLTDAYQEQNLALVEQILFKLQTDGIFDVASERVNNKDKLKQHIEQLRQAIMDIQAELYALQHDETYQTIQTLQGNYETYLTDLAKQLDDEIESLNQEFRACVD